MGHNAHLSESLIQNFGLSVTMATNQNVEFVQFLYAWWRTTQQTFIRTFRQNTCSEIAIKIYIHFSHYKSMETLSCHSNESAWTTAIKTHILYRLLLWTLLQSFSFIPLMASEAMIFFFREFIISVAMATNQIQRFGQNSYVSRGLLKEQFWKTFVKISAMR